MGNTEPNQENEWHLDKKVPISIIVVILIQAAMGLLAIADIKKDVEVLKAAMIQQAERDNRQDRSAYEAVALVRDDLKEVKALLQKILERNGAYK